ALLGIQLLGGREHAAQRRNASAGALDERGEPRDRRCVAERDPRAERGPAAEPLFHRRRARVKRVELIHPARALPQLELGPRHALQPLVAAPEERDHLAQSPATLAEVAKGPRVRRVHICTFAEEAQWHASRPAAGMRREATE